MADVGRIYLPLRVPCDGSDEPHLWCERRAPRNFGGFVVGVICSLIGTQMQGEFGPLVTLRIAIGSGTAFLVAQLIDVSIFSALKNDKWWRAPLASSIIGSTVDTALFFTIAFSAGLIFLEPSNDVSWANETLPVLGFGPVAPLWMSLAVADWGVKLTLALIALMPFKAITTRWYKNREHSA